MFSHRASPWCDDQQTQRVCVCVSYSIELHLLRVSSPCYRHTTESCSDTSHCFYKTPPAHTGSTLQTHTYCTCNVMKHKWSLWWQILLTGTMNLQKYQSKTAITARTQATDSTEHRMYLQWHFLISGMQEKGVAVVTWNENCARFRIYIGSHANNRFCRYSAEMTENSTAL